MTDTDTVLAARELLRRAGGAMETARLVALVGDDVTRALFRRGDIEAGHFVTVLKGAEDVERTIALQRGAVVTCLSAARSHGIPLIGRPPGAVHLAVPRTRGRLRGGPRTDGIVVHNESAPITTVPHRSWLADPATVISRMLLCADERQAVIAVDHVLSSNLVARDQIRVPGSGPGSAGARRAMARANGRARSIIETVARLDLEDAGIGPIEVAAEIESVGEVDLLIDGLVVAELDGRQHGRAEQFARDRERDLRLHNLGYVVRRFTSEQVWARDVVRSVRITLNQHVGFPRPVRVAFTGWRASAHDQSERLARMPTR